MKAKDLKNSILQMAVEGKLVPQDPSDEPASALLERIREERHRLIAEGKAKFPKGGESIIYTGSDGFPYEKRVDAKGRVLSDKCIADEVPFEMPKSWEWARLSAIATFGGGKTPSTNDKSNYSDDGILWITSKDMKRDHIDSTLITLSDKGASGLTLYGKGCIVMVTRSGILRRLLPVAILDRPATVNQDQKVILPDNTLLSEWLLCFFKSSDQRIRSDFGKDGTTVESIVFNKVKDMLIPIPPLAEQHRIVERVEELMPLVEEYGRLEDAREKLDAALPDRLRKSVLQMAVQGKLVPQDSTDEPASVLLERIREKKFALIKQKKVKFPKGGESVIYVGSDGGHYEKRLDAKGRVLSDECIEDEIPFDVPEGWTWARLGTLCDFGRCTNVEYDNIKQGTWCLDLEDLESDTGRVLTKKRKETDFKGSSKHVFSAGMVLYSKLRPYLNKVTIADEDGVCTPEILPLSFNALNAAYAMAVLMSPAFLSYAKAHSYGVKMPRLGTMDGANYLVAVPPYNEQERITEALWPFLSMLTNQ